MSLTETPRIRSLLRQAERNLEAGKLVAAEELYQQIVDEAPQSTAGWLGLSQAATDEGTRKMARERAAALGADGHEENVEAATAVPVPAEPGAPGQSQAATRPATSATASTVIDHAPAETLELVCYRHPGRETSLRCYKCNKPICSECTVKTPVGYLCPDCYREAEDTFFNARPIDYLLAVLVALPLSLLAGWLVTRFGSGFIFFILIFFIGGAVGGFIGRATKRVIGGRRGRYIPHAVAGCVILGAVLPALPLVLAVLFGNPGAIFGLIGPGIYLATAVSSAFFWAR